MLLEENITTLWNYIKNDSNISVEVLSALKEISDHESNKQPNERHLTDDSEELVLTCPNCGAWIKEYIKLNNNEFELDVKLKHCYWCGQALQWRKIDG